MQFKYSQIIVYINDNYSGIMFRTMIVSSTVWPFFFPDASGEICKEKKILYKLISGLHSSISIHIASDYLLDETTNWVQIFPSFPSRFYLHILPLFPYFILCCEEPLDRKQSKYTWEHAWILVLNQLYWNRNHLALKKYLINLLLFQWGRNLELAYDRVLQYPDRVGNLYFTFLFVLRAVTKVSSSGILFLIYK